MRNTGTEIEMRAEMAKAVAGLIRHAHGNAPFDSPAA